MQPSSQSRRAVRFGVFEVDFEAGELRKQGLKINLRGEQPFQVLLILLERSGEVVTQEELRRKLWPAAPFADFEHSLATAISRIRDALGDSAFSPRYIETLPSHGYRFIADVVVVNRTSLNRTEPTIALLPEKEDRNLIEVDGKPPSVRERLPKQLALKMSGLALVILAAVVAAWMFRLGSRAAAPIRSLAVLPLENLSGDASQNYFADGMTDGLITDLAMISALRVISRTSVMMYKGAHKPLPEIARELDVDAVVEGSVVRSGDQIRITAQLIQAPTDQHLWAESYQGNLRDTLSLQSRVASAVADQIRIEVTPQEQAALKRVEAIDPDAYEDYLKGRYFWNERTVEGLKRAVGYFDQAIAKDPNYAQAYSGLADTYALIGDWQYAGMTPREAMPRAKAAAMKALELDDSLGEGHNSLAFCLDGFDWDFDAADIEFRRSIALNPGYASAHHWYSWHLALMGRNAEAIAEMKSAENLDPVSPIINSDLAELLLIARLPDQSIEQSRRTIDMNPNFASAHNQLAQAYIEKKMFHEGISELQKAIQLSGGSSTFTANLARAYAGLNRKRSSVELLNDLIERSGPGYPDASEIAKIYAALGDNDKAMDWLEKGYQNRFNPGVLLRPGFDPLRGDPRFKDLVRRVGIPQQ